MLPLLQSVYSYSSPLSALPPALAYPLGVKGLGGACGALQWRYCDFHPWVILVDVLGKGYPFDLTVIRIAYPL